MARPRKDVALKARQGTLREHRERSRTPQVKGVDTTKNTGVAPGILRDYVAIANQYVADVLAGRLPACEDTRLAVERQRRDLERAVTDLTWPYVWSPEHATHACTFIEQLPHVTGKWDTALITLEPSQCFEICTFFGWRHRADVSRRRFTTKYKETARKSAKTTIDVAIALYHVAHENEPGAEVVFGATTGLQARIAFSIAQKMVRRSAFLRDLGFQCFANAITFDPLSGSLRPVNARASTLDGLAPSCILLDEAHAQSFELHDVLKSGQGSRPNPMLLTPTTAGYDLLSLGYTLRTTVQKMLRGVFEADHLFGIIYSLDEGDDWRDPTVWEKANPLLGVTPKREWMQKYCADAQQTPALEGEFKVKCCSLWLSSASAWLRMDRWDACADPTLTLDSFAGEPCWIGCDLAAKDDLAAVALVFKRADLIYAFVKTYLPRDVVEERARAVPEYRLWANAGLLEMTDGNMIDLSIIERDLRELCKTFEVQGIVLEQYGALNIAANLSNDGLPARIETKNSKTFTPPSLELEARVKAGKFRHDGNSLLKWAASNCVVDRRVDGSLLVKKRTAESPDKIDPIDAVLLALGELLAQPAPVQSVYDREDFDVSMVLV